jgi:hypothetical protein
MVKPVRLMYLSVSDITGPFTSYPLPSPLDVTFPCSNWGVSLPSPHTQTWSVWEQDKPIAAPLHVTDPLGR